MLSTRLILLTILTFLCSCKELKKETVETIQEQQRPNVIYILADDLGYGDLGCYGQQKIKTPNIDSMAAEGMLFTNHYAGNTVCSPSRVSLLTGFHQGHATVRGNYKNELTASDFTIAKMFKNSGYETNLIGKWGLGPVGTAGEPSKQGFDNYFGYLNQTRAHNYYPDYLIYNGEKLHLTNEVVYINNEKSKGIKSSATKKNDYSHSIFIDSALTYISKPKSKPFFLFLPLTIPHANNEGELTADHGMEVPNLGIYANKDWPEAEKAKAAMISLLDSDIGRILAKLKDIGIDENTLVIFTSDNGPHKEGGVDPNFFNSSGPLRGKKRDLYEGGIRVPFIAKWPSEIEKNSKSELQSAFYDMMPTFAQIVNDTTSISTDGLSILPTLLGDIQNQQVHDYLYWEFSEGKHDAQAVIAGKWKLLCKYHPYAWELYDLSNDIGEQTNVAGDYPAIVQKLKSYIAQAHTYNENYLLEGEKKPGT
ncbi:sulfatase-like hydrolase/transferase [Kriegella sp. EG-1]|nr:sulfatase-like hydrolase/transferase [Flavobacteriaceae bacterium EG-1]